MRFLVLALLLVGCAAEKNEDAEPVVSDKLGPLKELHDSRIAEAIALSDNEWGWITPDDCDGMLWTGKAAAGGQPNVNIVGSEYEDEGRLGRRPPPDCYLNGADNGAKTSWSRDMGVGFIYAAYRLGNVGALARHAAYGKAHKWQMGEPIDDGRTLYTPPLIGLLYQAIYKLGGEDNAARKIPNVYISGLDDFQAHLQVLDILLRGELEGGIRDVMLDRLKEHAKREPASPFYQAALGTYTGDMDAAIAACMKDDVSGYVRCEEFRRCQLADLIFSCDLVLRKLK